MDAFRRWLFWYRWDLKEFGRRRMAPEMSVCTYDGCEDFSEGFVEIEGKPWPLCALHRSLIRGKIERGETL